MPDIFVSYAREDHDWVSLFTRRLRDEGGWDIWWDLKLLPGEQFDNVIEGALDRAHCVIVIWSQHSIGSRWVRSEAREGAQRGVLVPLRIEGVTPPLEFRSFETADMSNWHGDAADAHFVEIVHVVRRAIDRTPTRTDADASRRDRDATEDVAAPVDARGTRRGAAAAGTALRYANLRSRAIYLWVGGVAAAIVMVVGIGLATRGAGVNTPLEKPTQEAEAARSQSTGSEDELAKLRTEAQVTEAFAAGVRAYELGIWNESVRNFRNAIDMQSALKQPPREVRVDGMRFVPYVPGYYLVAALLELKAECPAVLAAMYLAEKEPFPSGDLKRRYDDAFGRCGV